MSRERYSQYEFEIVCDQAEIWGSDGATGKYVNAYAYTIYGAFAAPYEDEEIQSAEWYDTEQEARFAAVGHISLLENGEG